MRSGLEVTKSFANTLRPKRAKFPSLSETLGYKTFENIFMLNVEKRYNLEQVLDPS